MTVLFLQPLNLQAAGFGISLTPSDGNLSYQDYLTQIKALEAWDIAHNSPEIVIAVIDSGVDVDHPDLTENIWHNSMEAKDGLDNDENGYIDDLIGWDFVLNSPDPRPKFGGDYTKLGIDHGTLVAGVIGAVGDNAFGVSGLSWKVKIMPLKVMDGEGSGSTSSVYHAMKYATDNGADIINLSMVGNAFDPLLDKAIAEAYEKGLIIVAAAGNESADGSTDDISLDLNKNPQYPICHDGGGDNNYILGVGAVDENDVKSKFSNYGSKCLDVVAPGENFWGLNFFSPVIPGFNKYYGGYWSGTSLAAPLVSGTAALIKSIRPDLSNKQIYQLIIENADDINNLNPRYRDLMGGGRLNMEKALKAAGGEAAIGSLIIAPASGYQPKVGTFNSFGNMQSEFWAYSQNFYGGVSLASVDLNNDGLKEIITGAGKTGGPHIRIFNSKGEVLQQFFAYETTFTGGVNVAAGDVDGDGYADIIVAPLGGKEPLVKVFTFDGLLKNQFVAYEKDFKSGVNLGLADINADGIFEIITGNGSGRTAEVRIFNSQGQLLRSFLPYGLFNGGVKVAAYNLMGDARTEIIVYPETNYDSQIRIFSASGDIISLWQPWTDYQADHGSLTVGNIDGDDLAEIIVGNVINSQSKVKIFKADGQLKNQFLVFGDSFNGGVNLSIK